MLQGTRFRAMRTATTIALLALGLNGCAAHHKVRPFVMPPFTPVELAQIPEPQDLPMVEGDEEEELPPVPVAEGATTPKRQRRRPAKVAAPAPDVAPPVPVAAATAPVPAASAPVDNAADVIGELTPGGDQDPKAQQEATDLIAANEKRLSALPADTVRAQASLVSNVRNFQRQAQQALRTGDAGGAKTLATKGKLLLDDLEKAAGL